MVERWTIDGFTYCPIMKDDGGFVRHSDYAALEAKLAERVKVKPLDWDELNEGKTFRALLPIIGSIRVEPYGVCGWWEVLWSMPGQCDKLVPDVFDTPEEAKAAAQADYERRILSALEATPPAPKVAEVGGAALVLNMDEVTRTLQNAVSLYIARLGEAVDKTIDAAPAPKVKTAKPTYCQYPKCHCVIKCDETLTAAQKAGKP